MKIKILVIVLFISCKIWAQDSLPNFSATVIAKNKAVISWKNQFANKCTQISVQRSYDSLKFFKSVFSSLSPELPENGYVDNDYLSGLKNYYRILYVLEDGSFYFTKSTTPKTTTTTIDITKLETKSVDIEGKEKIKKIKKDAIKKAQDKIKQNNAYNQIFIDSIQKHIEDSINKYIDDSITALPKIKYYSVYKRNQKKVFAIFEENDYCNFKDSIELHTKDTLVEYENERVIWNDYITPAWKPSKLVFTNDRGYLEIALKDYKNKKYKIIFFDKNNKQLFSIKSITSETLTLDKSNFLSAGWYFFEVYENDKLIEKNKFLLEQDF